MGVSKRPGPAVAADLAAMGETPAEVVGGVVVRKASPSYEHGDAQTALLAFLRARFHRRGGGDSPGGWWIVAECEIELEAHEVYRPDISGWRRDRSSERPRGRPVRIRPDWVCEVLSASNARHDLVTKLRTYHRHQVTHYWIADPDEQVLIVHRWQADGYLVALTAGRDETVRAEPFEAVELRVATLFGEDEP